MTQSPTFLWNSGDRQGPCFNCVQSPLNHSTLLTQSLNKGLEKDTKTHLKAVFHVGDIAHWFLYLTCFSVLKRHGDAKSSELDKIEFFDGFCKFCLVLENMRFHKITSFIK